MSEDATFMNPSRGCAICRDAINSNANYCRRCRDLIKRSHPKRKPNKDARVKALKEAWDGKGFRCYYTGVRLVENDPKSPRYITFDHRFPRQEDEIVVTMALINDMKSDMDEDEFKKMVLNLARRFKDGYFDEAALDLKYWKR